MWKYKRRICNLILGLEGLIDKYLVDCFNFIYNFGELSNIKKLAILKHIEKRRKRQTINQEWAANLAYYVDAKIISKVL